MGDSTNLEYLVVESTEVEEPAGMEKFGRADEEANEVVARILGYRLVPRSAPDKPS